MKPQPNVRDGFLVRGLMRHCPPRPGKDHRPHRAIRAMPDAQVRGARFDLEVLAHLKPEPRQAEDIRFRELPLARALPRQIAVGQRGGIAFQQIERRTRRRECYEKPKAQREPNVLAHPAGETRSPPPVCHGRNKYFHFHTSPLTHCSTN